MPSIKENFDKWNKDYAWPDDGEEWSAPWGTSETQWNEWILPRIKQYLPQKSILEIGPGHGRWTTYLRNHCQFLHLIDLSPRCIAYCMARFSDAENISYHVNGGDDLNAISNSSIDFVFSFDSLVHADAAVCYKYLCQIGEKLTQNGVCFLHHSNLGSYSRALPQFVLPRIECWRSRTMTADLLIDYCADAGLCCFKQELVAWGPSEWSIDGLSYLTPINSSLSRQSREIVMVQPPRKHL